MDRKRDNPGRISKTQHQIHREMNSKSINKGPRGKSETAT